ncbi:hypothetical protein Droror1_Dr00021273 [Drosera rotundifolia]
MICVTQFPLFHRHFTPFTGIMVLILLLSPAFQSSHFTTWCLYPFDPLQAGVEIDDFVRTSRQLLQPLEDFFNNVFVMVNVHPDMRKTASELFGKPELLHSRPNVFGELINILISPSESIEEAVDSVFPNADNPDISLHMRMLMNRRRRSYTEGLDNAGKTTLLHMLKDEVRFVSSTFHCNDHPE